MPEYLTPGVYVEETSFRATSIEGVPTSTFGMAGLSRYGPVSYRLADGTNVTARPLLVTSYTEYERAFGDLASPSEDGLPNYLGHAARAFFANGGRRLYVSRVFGWPVGADGETDPAAVDQCFARRAVRSPGAAADTPPLASWRARWPGAAGRRVRVSTALRRGRNSIVVTAAGGQPSGRLVGVREDALVLVLPREAPVPARLDPATIRVVRRAPDRSLGFETAAGDVEPVPADAAGYQLELDVTVELDGVRADTYPQLAVDPRHPRSVFRVLRAQDPADELALAWLSPAPGADGGRAPTQGEILVALLDDASQGYLVDGTSGTDGELLTPADLAGRAADPDSATDPATGTEALGEIDDIALVATPDLVRFTDETAVRTAVDGLVGHCERLRYRMAIVDPPAESSISQVREFRSQFDSSYAALYYPWLRVLDPEQRPDPGAAPATLLLPPSGFVAGVYARSDVERGVHKAPANEVVRGISEFETNVTFDRQSVLNPEGINALRFFEGRSNRVWGARTMSSDPEWRYVNVRRLFIFLEHSIDQATQWAVFEPNNERLWASIRQSVEDFLLVVWRSGALLGSRPEDAYFVRCDRTTMTQSDLDNGRLICLVGVAPTYPAEFVVFRIGQWTADARQT